LSVFQWTGLDNADLGNGGNWFDTDEPGQTQTPGVGDVAIIQNGQGLTGTLNVGVLDIVSDSATTSISITGSSTQVTAASVGIDYGFTLDTGATLQAGALAIGGDGTAVTVQNNAILDDSAGLNDMLTIGDGSESASLLLTKGGIMYYTSSGASGTLNLGGVSNSTATMTVSAGGYFGSTLSGLNIGAAAGSSGLVDVTGAGSQFLVDNYGATVIGDDGVLGGSAQGTVEVTAGGYASLSSDYGVFIGTSGGMAKVVVSGADSAIEEGPNLEIGASESNIAGEVLVQSGGEFDAATDTYLNNGTISVTGANSVYTSRFLVMDAGTIVKVTTGGLVHVADVTEFGGEISLAAGSLIVRGTIYMDSGSEIIGAGTVTATTIENSANIIAGGGTLVVNGPILGSGYERIGSGAVLQLNGGVGSAQNVVFDSGANKLVLGEVADFGGHILDFAAGDAIDILGKAATKVSYSGGTLTIDNGTTLVAKLKITGSYTTANFKLTSDNHNGSLISYAASAAERPIGEPIYQVPIAHFL